MKFISILIFLIIAIFNKPEPKHSEIIMFQPVGETFSVLKPLVISTHIVHIPLNDDERNMQKRNNGKVNFTEKEIDDITDVDYMKIITDSLTFNAIGKFIATHPKYYSNSKKQVNMPEAITFIINYNGKYYPVCSKLAPKFLVDLKSYLITNHYDIQLANKIGNFRFDSRPR